MSEQKSVIDKILQPLGLTTIKLESQVVKLETMKLDDGTTVLEADMFEKDNAVMIVTEDEQKIPLPVGVYGLEDGRELEVQEEGVIFEVREVAAEGEQEETEEVEASKAPVTLPTPKRTIESVSKESYFSKATKEDLIDLIATTVELKMAEAKPTVEKEEKVEEAVKPIVPNPENGRVDLAKSLNTKENFTEWLNNRK